MSQNNPTVAEEVVLPIDGTQEQPSLSIGGDSVNNSGTGMYGTYGEINQTISAQQATQLNSLGFKIVNGDLIFNNGTKVSVSGDDVTFTNEAGDKSFTITMV